MRKSIPALCLMLALLFAGSCSENSTGNEELKPLDFTTTPTSELSQIVNNTPSDFTWGFYNDNILLGLDPKPESFEGEIVISAFQVKGGEVVNRLTTSSVGTTLEELSAELSTKDMYPGSMWMPGGDWVSSTKWVPSTQWYPGSMWAPSEIENKALSQNDLSAGETLVVIYPHLPGESVEREVLTQPYGIVFRKR